MGADNPPDAEGVREAEAYPGPSLIIAYSHCIAHGIDMATRMGHQKEAVDSGYWPLYRYDPTTLDGTRSTWTAAADDPAQGVRPQGGPLRHARARATPKQAERLPLVARRTSRRSDGALRAARRHSSARPAEAGGADRA